MKIFKHDENWILNRCAKELEPLLDKFDGLEYYINYTMWHGKTDAKKTAALFTHLEPSGPAHEKFKRVAKEVDLAIALSDKTAKDVAIAGNKNIEVIHCGSDLEKNNITFGVVGRTYPGGRKGEAIVDEIQQTIPVKFLALGEGWPCEIYSKKVDKDTRMEFYDQIDYLVITSEYEGGPVPMLDAMAVGVPIIAPDVGWAWEYPCIEYRSVDELVDIIGYFSSPRRWSHWTNEHELAFKGLMS